MGNGWKLNVQQYIIPDSGNSQNGASTDKYTYVDAAGISHRFDTQAHKQGGAGWYFYSTSGIGMTLMVPGVAYSTTNYYGYTLIDDMGADGSAGSSGNQLNFDTQGRLINTVSAVNPAIKKVFTYNDSGKLVEIHDNRKSSRKIKLTYHNSGADDGRLDKIEYESATSTVEQTLNYKYASGNLTYITRSANSTPEPVAHFVYDAGKLAKAIDGKDFSAIKVEYESNLSESIYKVKKVSSGCCSVTGSHPSFNLGDVVGSACKTWTAFKYGSVTAGGTTRYHRTTVVNNKYIALDYYLNEKGFTTGVLERRGGASGENDSALNSDGANLMTLTKDGGLDILDGDNGTPQINKQKAKECSITSTSDSDYELTSAISHTKVNQFRGTGISSDTRTYGGTIHGDKVKFVVSFWMKHTLDITANGHPGCQVEFVPNKYGHPVYFDHTAYNAWQYITIPFGVSQENFVAGTNNISSAKLKFFVKSGALTNSNATITVANMRISVAQPTPVPYIIYTANNGNETHYPLKDLSQAITAGSYTYANKTGTVSADFFVTEGDIQQTLLNMRKAYYNGSQHEFDFVYNGGTAKYGDVKTVTLKFGNISVPLTISGNESNFYLKAETANVKFESDGPDDGTIKVTSKFGTVQRQIYDGSDYTFGNINGVRSTVVKTESGITETEETFADYFGRVIEKVDSYGVKTEYTYDGFGNPTTVRVSGKNPETGKTDSVYYTADYGSSNNASNEYKREFIANTKADGIQTNYTYTSKYGLPETVKGQGYTDNGVTNPPATVEYGYNAFGGLTGVCAKASDNTTLLAQNIITLDTNGRIGSVSDGPDYSYGFQYNGFGDVTEYNMSYKNVSNQTITDTLLTKTYDYDGGVVTEEYFRHTDGSRSDIIAAYSDKYGRPMHVTVGMCSGAQTTEYTYQNDTNGDDFNPYPPTMNGGSFIDHERNHTAANNPFKRRPVVNESPLVAKISQISDPYEKRTYTYDYDLENNPCGYSAPESANSGGVYPPADAYDVYAGWRFDGLKAVSVRQVSPSVTSYRWGEGGDRHNNTEVVINRDEGHRFGPRIDETSTYHGFSSSSFMIETKKYEYDGLGRPSGIEGTYIDMSENSDTEDDDWREEFEYGEGDESAADYDEDSAGKIESQSHLVTYETKANIEIKTAVETQFEYTKRGQFASETEAFKVWTRVVPEDEDPLSPPPTTPQPLTPWKEVQPDSVSTIRKRSYRYDTLDRVTEEKFERNPNYADPNSVPTLDKHYEYSYYGYGQTNGRGRLREIKNVLSDSGRKFACNPKDGRVYLVAPGSYDNHGNWSSGGTEYEYLYDNFGNVCGREELTHSGSVLTGNLSLSYERGNLLSGYEDFDYHGGMTYSRGYGHYSYNHQGVRFKKTAGKRTSGAPNGPQTWEGVTTEYWLDGDKILGEDRTDGKQLRYNYDLRGLSSVDYSYRSEDDKAIWDHYAYVCDEVFGHVKAITQYGRAVAEYDYNAFGELVSLTAHERYEIGSDPNISTAHMSVTYDGNGLRKSAAVSVTGSSSEDLSGNPIPGDFATFTYNAGGTVVTSSARRNNGADEYTGASYTYDSYGALATAVLRTYEKVAGKWQEKSTSPAKYGTLGNPSIGSLPSGWLLAVPGTPIIAATHIAFVNPFRWKRHYWDVETGWYYIDGRYYDPYSAMYLDAASPESLLLNAATLGGLDRHGIGLNPMWLAVYAFTIFCVAGQLGVDPLRYPNEYFKSAWEIIGDWWRYHWVEALELALFAAVLLVSVVLMCFPATMGFGIAMFAAGVKCAVGGFIIGGVIGGVVAANQGGGIEDIVVGICQGALFGVVEGFIVGAAFYGVFHGIANGVKAINSAWITRLARTTGPAKPTNQIAKPIVQNQKLQNHIDQLYKGINSPDKIGNGTTMDAIRYERFFVQKVGKKWHTGKGVDHFNGISDLLAKGNLNAQDTLVAQKILAELDEVLKLPILG